MKKFTLMSLIGISIIILESIVNFLQFLNVIPYYSSVMLVIMNMLSLIAWVLIGSFFFMLYKKQK